MTTTAAGSASTYLLEAGTLIKQGAEAVCIDADWVCKADKQKVYVLPSLYPEPKTFHPQSYNPPSTSTSSPHASSSSSSSSRAGPPAVIKYRFPKTYRHPTLDATLTRARLSFEARALARCARAGVTVPTVLWVDEAQGVLGMEKVEGWSIREVLGGGAEGEAQDEDEEELAERDHAAEKDTAASATDHDESEGTTALRNAGKSVEDLMSSIGSALAKLHATNIIHGDLTTSNMMLRLTPHHPSEPYEIVLIDFGLSSTAQFPEHFAVDLYVLERAFASTHPQSEGLYAGVLEAYAKGLGEKKWKPIETKLKEVRLRGRKRDMTG